MAITLDTKVSVLLQNDGATGTINIGTNNDRALVISLATFNGTISSMNYQNSGGSVSLTQIASSPSGSQCRADMWYAVNPPTGLGTLTIHTGSGFFMMVELESWYNVWQSNPINTSGTAAGTSGTSIVSLTTTAANTMLVDSYAGAAAGTKDASQTLLDTQSGQNQFSYQHEGASYKAQAGTANTTMQWTHSSAEWEMVAAALNVAPTHSNYSISLKMKVVNNNHPLGMKMRVEQVVQTTIGMKVRIANPYLAGRLSKLDVRCIDIQKFTKDTLQNQSATALSTNLCNFLANNFNLTHIATVGLIDYTTLYPGGFTVSPLTSQQYNKQWCDAIHATGLKVVHRMTSMSMEGPPNFPTWPLRVGSGAYPRGALSDIIPTTITDNFNRTSIGSNYFVTAVSGGFWEISGGRLAIINSGNEFSYNYARTINTYGDGTFIATVEKSSFGHDGIMICLSTTGSSPFIAGYGVHMSGTNTLSLEDVGQRNISADTRVILASDTSTTFTTGDFYRIKVVKSGTSIQIKVWDINNNEPGSYQISTTDSTYSSGWMAFTTDGFGKVLHFDDLEIDPAQNLNSYIGMAVSWIINNPTTFSSGDILAPFPEFDTCNNFNVNCYFNPSASWLGAQYGQITIQWLSDLKTACDWATTQIGVPGVLSGYTTVNFTSLQSVTDPGKVPPNFNDLDYTDSNGQKIMYKVGSTVFDWYGTTSVTLFNPTGAAHPPQEMYDSIYAVWNKYKVPAFLQEWGGFVSINLNDVSAHDIYYRTVFENFAKLNDVGALSKFSYWGAQDTGDADTGLLQNSSTNWSSPTLRVKGQALRDYYQTGIPTMRTLKMKLTTPITPTTRTIGLKLRNAGVGPIGRLSGLKYRSIDLMKWQKDTVTAQPTDATIHNVVRFAASNFNLTHLACCFPIDPVSFYPPNLDHLQQETGFYILQETGDKINLESYNTNTFVPSPRTVVQCYQKWVDEIHSYNINVLHRCVSFGMEGDSGFTRLTGGNVYPQGTAASAPTDGNLTWLGILYNFIINNPTLFHDGDLFAPFPERTEGLFDQPNGIHSFLSTASPGIQSRYAQFFIDVKTTADAAFAVIGRNVSTGFTSDNYSEVRSGYIFQSLYDAEKRVNFDYYQNYNQNGYGATALSEDLDAVYFAKNQYPLGYEEWGTTPDMIRATDSAKDSNPPGGAVMADSNGVFHTLQYWGIQANPAGRAKLFNLVLGTIADKVALGRLDLFNYWGFWDTGINDSGLIQITGSTDNYSSFSLRPEAYILQAFYNTNNSTPPIPTNEITRPLHRHTPRIARIR